ncbi:SLOG family protein [Streptomyces collinus]|uniref:SLOG family protein n=1 Tax=Streptomyces collinus TaxID=42684 RepID=UPI0034277FD3
MLAEKDEVRGVLELAEGRVLICGSRRWPWPSAVEAVLDRLLARYGDRLVVIEGSATGADAAACTWCCRHGLDADRHRCHPVDWAAAGARARSTGGWRGRSGTRGCCCRSNQNS